MTSRTIVYTDGACSGNPGPGGWAWVVPDGPFAAGFEAHTTNQRMELTAVLEAIGEIDGPLEIVSDSSYVVNCFRDRWWEGWLARGWISSQRKPVANRDLWEPIIAAYRSRDLSFRWVKGHSGDPWNDVADRLAVEAGTRLEGRSGVKPPSDLGPTDAPKPRTPPPADSQQPPGGHRILVTGHRPPDLGGYDDNPMRAAVRRRLVDVLAAKRSLHPDLVVMSGMGLGAETLAAEAAIDVAVPLVPVIAYPDFDSVWPAETRSHYADLLGEAQPAIMLQKRKPATRQQAGAAQARRDAWLRRHAAEAILVWNGGEGPLAKAARSIIQELGEENVWIIDPSELG